MQDLRFALRLLWRSPGFALSAVLTLAIGIGANTGIYSVLNGAFKPLPVPHARQIVAIAAELPGDETGFRFQFSYAALGDFQASTRDVFSDVFAYDNRLSGLGHGGVTSQFVYQAVSGNTFKALQLEPAAGRFFMPGEGEAFGTERAVVFGHRFWLRRFGGDPAIVGAMVQLDGQPTRVIGVAPRGFHGLAAHAEIDGYVTFGMLRSEAIERGTWFTDRHIRTLAVLARLRPDAGVREAQSAVDVLMARLRRQYPAEESGVAARVMPETSARPVPGRILTAIVPIVYASTLALAGLVLLIACMNVANLLLVRATARQREFAVRSAIGARRGRLIRLLLIESLLISIAGLGVGLAFARIATALFVSAINPSFDIQLNLDFEYDWRVFAYASFVACATGTLTGLVPAFRGSRVRVGAVLHDGGHGGSVGPARQRLRSGLVIAQVAGSLILLIVAGLCVRNLQRAQWTDLGFVPEGLAAVRLDPGQVGYTDARSVEFYEELERRLRAMPSVESVATAISVPMGYIFFGCQASAEGVPVPSDRPRDAFLCNPVSSAYFDAMKLPIVEGRAFTEQDTSSTLPVVIVNQTLAKRLWPDESAVGKRLVMPRQRALRTVVGVARNGRYLAPFEKDLPYLYLAMKQDTDSSLRVVHVRVNGDAEAFLPVLERHVRELDPAVPIADLRTMPQMVEGGMTLLFLRLATLQVGALGLLGLLLAVVGVYGVVSYSATQRTREIGIRLALGAAPRAIGRLVIGQGALLVTGGILLGLGAAALVTRALSRLFFLVGATDAATFAVVAAMLAAIALFACYLPARRAMRVNPIVALRHE